MKRSNAARTACLALALVLAAACLAGCESAQGGAADFGGEMPEGMELPEGMEPPEGTGTGTVGGTGTAGGGAQSQTLQVEVAETVTGEVESIVGNEVTLLLTDGTAALRGTRGGRHPCCNARSLRIPRGDGGRGSRADGGNRILWSGDGHLSSARGHAHRRRRLQHGEYRHGA